MRVAPALIAVAARTGCGSLASTAEPAGDAPKTSGRGTAPLAQAASHARTLPMGRSADGNTWIGAQLQHVTQNVRQHVTILESGA
jgi:hypothetical protein